MVAVYHNGNGNNNDNDNRVPGTAGGGSEKLGSSNHPDRGPGPPGAQAYRPHRPSRTHIPTKATRRPGLKAWPQTCPHKPPGAQACRPGRPGPQALRHSHTSYVHLPLSSHGTGTISVLHLKTRTAARHSAARHGAARLSVARHCVVRHSAAHPSAPQHSASQRSAPQRSAPQRSAA